jgi:hypothetical protein
MADRLVLAALAAVLWGCPSPGPEPPTTTPVQPGPTQVRWWARLAAAAPDEAALQALQPLPVGGLLLAEDVHRFGEGLPSASGDLPVGVEVAGFGDGPLPTCFDPALPGSDPVIAARAQQVLELVRDHPQVTFVAVDAAAPPGPSAAVCDCNACEDEPDELEASKLTTLWRALRQAAAEEGAAPWWWDRVDGRSPIDPSQWVDDARDGLANSERVRTTAVRGPAHRWAPSAPAAEAWPGPSLLVDLDLAGARFGRSDAAVVFAHEIEDRSRTQGSRGVLGWVTQVDVAGEVPDHPAARAARGAFAARWQERARSTLEGLAEWMQDEWLLDADTALTLARDLGATGLALDLATHPLGIGPSDTSRLPSSLPLQLVDPSRWDGAWAERFASLATPDRETLVRAHGWTAQGVAAAEAAVSTAQAVFEQLPPEVAEPLLASVRSTQTLARIWHRLLNAELTSRALGTVTGAGPWLRADADALELLAAGLPPEDERADRLAGLAQALRALVGDGPATERAFPVISAVHAEIDGEDIAVTWRLDPPGAGWVELGPGWPTWDESSERREGPDATWEARIPARGVDARLAFRVCGEVGDDVVCSADDAAWTAP